MGNEERKIKEALRVRPVFPWSNGVEASLWEELRDRREIADYRAQRQEDSLVFLMKEKDAVKDIQQIMCGFWDKTACST